MAPRTVSPLNQPYAVHRVWQIGDDDTAVDNTLVGDPWTANGDADSGPPPKRSDVRELLARARSAATPNVTAQAKQPLTSGASASKSPLATAPASATLKNASIGNLAPNTATAMPAVAPAEKPSVAPVAKASIALAAKPNIALPAKAGFALAAKPNIALPAKASIALAAKPSPNPVAAKPSPNPVAAKPSPNPVAAKPSPTPNAAKPNPNPNPNAAKPNPTPTAKPSLPPAAEPKLAPVVTAAQKPIGIPAAPAVVPTISAAAAPCAAAQDEGSSIELDDICVEVPLFGSGALPVPATIEPAAKSLFVAAAPDPFAFAPGPSYPAAPTFAIVEDASDLAFEQALRGGSKNRVASLVTTATAVLWFVLFVTSALFRGLLAAHVRLWRLTSERLRPYWVRATETAREGR